MSMLQHIPGHTFHGRRGAQGNRFTYGVDYLLIDPEARTGLPWLFRRNRPGPVSLHDSDHGGVPGRGDGITWVRRVLAGAGLDTADGQVLLLAQPRILGHVFNPVAFWLCYGRDDTLRCVIAEVTNTYGDRHSYLCHHDDQRPIGPDCALQARKILHVSPFQPVEGDYRFRFDIAPEKIAIRIDYGHGEGGLVATLAGPRRPLTSAGLTRAMLRRPFGSRRVLALIHWQALKLWWKGAAFRPRPLPPADEVSR
ncbi:DUF1365 domain-containing protein [Pararhodobacter sp. SW119]|uniref:DUF1365 domain-containing protein n=1 Tax=Pararhodobacter sp. SW119 TaxID=2780075 RepID=UPI001AE05125|nr:DUF1365 domain-containing protein [Pararhodobacter sp. SW119]